MRTRIAAAVAALVFGAVAFAPAADPATTRLVFRDEFTASTIDSTKWNVRDSTYAGNEQSCQFARQVRQAAGVLSIRVDRGTYTCGSRTSEFASGYVDSIVRMPAVKVGDLIVFRARMPITPGRSQGFWPALWIRSNEPESTYQAGEIDVLEVWGSVKPDVDDADRTSIHTVHENTSGTGSKAGFVYRFPAGHSGDGFHVYSAKLLRNRVEFRVDGVLVRTVTATRYPWISKLLAPGVRWNVRMNVQVARSSSWMLAPNDATVFPQTMDVDYVRVFRTA